MRDRTVGVVSHDRKSSAKGVTLISCGRESYLIDMEGRVVHEWYVRRSSPSMRDFLRSFRTRRGERVFLRTQCVSEVQMLGTFGVLILCNRCVDGVIVNVALCVSLERVSARRFRVVRMRNRRERERSRVFLHTTEYISCFHIQHTFGTLIYCHRVSERNSVKSHCG